MYVKGNPIEQLSRQVNSMYGITNDEIRQIAIAYETVLDRLEYQFTHIANKYYHDAVGGAVFNIFHTGQWTMFLYLMSHELMAKNKGNITLCDKIYGISKCLSSADIFYAIDFPDIFFFDHPQGSVMGRAKYGNYFSFSQGCTVGNNKGKYPTIGEHVTLFSDSKILGCCKVGNYVIFSANSFILDENIPSYSIVFGMHPNITIHSITKDRFNDLTRDIFVNDY